MAREWTVVSDVRSFLADKGHRNVGVHALTKRVAHWACCTRCGLLALKNDVTRKALKGACVVYE